MEGWRDKGGKEHFHLLQDLAWALSLCWKRSRAGSYFCHCSCFLLLYFYTSISFFLPSLEGTLSQELQCFFNKYFSSSWLRPWKG